MDAARVRHWQEAWAKAGVSTGRRIAGRNKYYAVIAYPGTSGLLHVGHLRQFAYADPLHRYHRMLGEQSLFPFGVHASGLPAVTWAQRVKDRDPATLRQLVRAGVRERELARLEDPETAARFLGDSYRAVLRSLGILVDETTYLTTVDADYRAFVRWQFGALHAAGALIQGTYYASVCPVCGPVAVDPSETDLSSGGTAEVVRFTTVPFRLEDGRILLAATLRPETVYGVTNLWLRPGEGLVVWHHGSAAFVVSRAGGERLVEQHGGHLGHELLASELVGRTVVVPLTGRSVPVLESDLVDPDLGTGVVMSVPAHAPADAAALRELPEETRARLGAVPVILEIPADASLTPSESELVVGIGTPAERALAALRVRSLADADALAEATERSYRLEFVRGRMTVPELAAVSVREARDRVARRLREEGTSFEVQEFSVPVVCRNGHAVIIRRVPDQWFLHYGDPAWKASTLAASARVSSWPPEFARELSEIVEWFNDRPCTRRGRWLGTPFPYDPEWVIEPIADSTFYMAYYVVRRFVSTGRLRAEELTPPFFDYVFLGRGPGEPTVDRALQEEVRAEFLYWYPLDLNMGGKEHKRVHFPAFLYTHVRLLPPELLPRGVYVTGWITGPSGEKLSKKEVGTKGGRIPSIDEALERWGPDALRLFYVLAASPAQDIEWDPDLVDTIAGRLDDVERVVRESAGDSAGRPELDAWLFSRMRDLVRRVRAAYDAGELREAAELTYVAIPSLLRRYYARGGVPGAPTHRVAGAWVRLLSPMTPHLAEELGEGRFGGLVAVQPMPSPDDFPASEVAEAREAFLERVEEDLRAVLRPVTERGEPVPEEAIFYVAPGWKATVESWVREASERGETLGVREAMDRSASHPEVMARRGELAKYLARVQALVRAEPPPAHRPVDEVETLRSAEGYLVRRFGFRSISVYREEEAATFDPMGRRDRARPGRPAFYLMRRPATDG